MMDIVERLRKSANTIYKQDGYTFRLGLQNEAANEIERLRGALRSIDNLIPKTKEIVGLPYCMAIAGDIAESALNGTWPAYGIMPAPAKEKE